MTDEAIRRVLNISDSTVIDDAKEYEALNQLIDDNPAARKRFISFMKAQSSRDLHIDLVLNHRVTVAPIDVDDEFARWLLGLTNSEKVSSPHHEDILLLFVVPGLKSLLKRGFEIFKEQK